MKYQSQVDNINTERIARRFLTGLVRAKIKRSAKIWLILIPALVFCASAFFALIHHFYRYAWAGTLWYYGTIIAVLIIFGELALILFQE